MMDTFIYFSLAGAYLVLFLMGCLLANRYGWINVENVLLIVIVALFYDNGIQALGKYVGESMLLQSLNHARYGLHALCTPLLILFAWRTLVNANLAWANKNIALWLTVIVTIGSILIEFATGVWGISLAPNWENGVLSYVKTDQAGIPLMIIIVITALFITSIIIWWKQRWPVYFLGVLSICAAPLIHILLRTGASHNIAEFLLMTALLATVSFQQKKLLL
jgi:hypothetical protein